MHVVAEVRDHEGEVGKPVTGEVPREPGERDDAVAAGTRVDDVAEVEERVVLLRVPARRAAGEARIREPLGVGLPRLPGSRERVGKAPGLDDAACAIARDPLCRAGHEREVVRQARVGDGVVVRHRCAAPRERVERRCRGIAGDRRRLVVLEHHENDVREGRHPDGRRSGGRNGRTCRAATAAAAGNDEPEREGEREPTRYSRFSSHFLPRCVTKKPIRSASTIPAAA